MHLFMEAGMRGGVAQISKRYAKANIPNLPEFEADKAKSHLIYLDANNLYGWAMSQSLQTGGFKWKNEEFIASLNELSIEDMGDNDSTGYILEVDLGKLSIYSFIFFSLQVKESLLLLFIIIIII